MNVTVLGDRVLVALPPAPDDITTASGILLIRDPDAVRIPTRGIVVQVGEKRGQVGLDDVLALMNGPDVLRYYEIHDCICDLVKAINALAPAPFDVQVGDCVLFPPSAGDELEQDGISYVVLRESEIIGIVAPIEAAA